MKNGRKKIMTKHDLNRLFQSIKLPKDGVIFHEVVRNMEIAVIKAALRCTGGNQTQAAKDLKMLYSTLHEKVKKYGINPKVFYKQKK